MSAWRGAFVNTGITFSQAMVQTHVLKEPVSLESIAVDVQCSVLVTPASKCVASALLLSVRRRKSHRPAGFRVLCVMFVRERAVGLLREDGEARVLLSKRPLYIP